jgi:hypothetical protein
METAYVEFGNRSFYDLAAPSVSSFPAEYFTGFLSKRWVQADLGVAVNYTESSYAIYDAFIANGDYIRDGSMRDLGYILDAGIKVALVYGDRDYACPWTGGENVSLNIPWSRKSDFQESGYTSIQVNDSYIGGQVRQYGNLSFSRVYQAGHEVPAYQPQTAYEIFRRIMGNLDVATGQVGTGSASASTRRTYATSGPMDTWGIKMSPPPPEPAECYILSPESTCTREVFETVLNGTAIIKDYIVQAKQDLTSGNHKPKSSHATIPHMPPNPALFAVFGGVLTSSLFHL